MHVHSQEARRATGWILGLAALSSLALCYQIMNPRVSLSDVTGRVTYSGRPLTGAYICLASDNGNLSALGKVGADGTFRVQSETNHDGARPGRYHAYLAVRGGSALPAKFCDPRTSGLEIEVASGWSDFNIELH